MRQQPYPKGCPALLLSKMAKVQLQELQKKGLPVSSDTTAVIQGLSEQHKTHQLRYTVLVDDGTKTYWPPLSLVFAALEELLLLTRISTHGV